jgi:ABC-2 type transport system ATP-binding protein
LLLDEPTAGLDPLMDEVFRACILEERARGRTVLLSSHVLAEVEALCDRVSIIRNGRTVEHGSLAELRYLRRTTIQAELQAPPAQALDPPGVHDLEIDGTRLRCTVDSSDLNALLRALTAIGLRGLISQPPTLEQLFLQHYVTAATDNVETAR